MSLIFCKSECSYHSAALSLRPVFGGLSAFGNIRTCHRQIPTVAEITALCPVSAVISSYNSQSKTGNIHVHILESYGEIAYLHLSGHINCNNIALVCLARIACQPDVIISVSEHSWVKLSENAAVNSFRALTDRRKFICACGSIFKGIFYQTAALCRTDNIRGRSYFLYIIGGSYLNEKLAFIGIICIFSAAAFGNIKHILEVGYISVLGSEYGIKKILPCLFGNKYSLFVCVKCDCSFVYRNNKALNLIIGKIFYLHKNRDFISHLCFIMLTVIKSVVIYYQRYSDRLFTCSGTAFRNSECYCLCNAASRFINCGNNDLICSCMCGSIACL